MKKKTFKFIGSALMVAGFFGVIGSVGALDTEAISALQTVIQVFGSIGLGFVGLLFTVYGTQEEVTNDEN